MKFGIITHAIHKIRDKNIYAYEPYVREMNLWGKSIEEILVLAPVSVDEINKIEIAYEHNNIKVLEIPNFHIKSFKNILLTILLVPNICWKIFNVMREVDHIHIRCPGNVGLLGCFIQVFFPKKMKTVKYAGNWDPKSKQPISYRLQKWIVSNTFLTRNCKVLVYGEWKNQSKNIIPFFTASYKKEEIVEVHKKKLSKAIKFIYVGSFTNGKQPFLSVKVVEDLFLQGFDVQLNMYGEGECYSEIKNYIRDKSLDKIILLHGNQTQQIVKDAYKKSHFLIFISKSEGWPKVIAEAMFWRCLPISSNISCVNYMLDNETRGSLLKSDTTIAEVVKEVKKYFEDENLYQKKVINAVNWSQKFTLDKFEEEIKIILNE